MARGKLIVMNEPKSPAVEDEYNDWYSHTHVTQILEHVPSITKATRLKLVPGGLPNNVPGQPRYLAIYDIEADDLQAAFAELGAATQAGKVVMSDTIRSEPSSTVLIYEEI